MKKKLKSDGIFFTGKSAEDVTGSQAFIRFGDTQILLECGLHQSRSKKCISVKFSDAISKQDKSYRVVCAAKDFVVHL